MTTTTRDSTHVVADLAVERGLTVHDVRSDSAARAGLLRDAGVGSLPRGGWSQVARVVDVRSQQVAGVRSRCRSCGAPIKWVSTEASEATMPLDPLPTVLGNVVLVVPPGRARQRARVLGDPGEEWPRWRSHFATCPRRHRFRAARESEAGWGVADLRGHPMVLCETVEDTTRCLVGQCRWRFTSGVEEELDDMWALHYATEHQEQLRRKHCDGP